MTPALVALALAATPIEELAPPAVAQARLADPALREASGLVASRRHPGVLWTHNDGDNPAELFAIDREGRTLARFPVAAPNVDWEDIALDARGIYLADVGDNRRERTERIVYRIAEPDPRSTAADPLPVRARWRLATPPEGAFDCEALVVHGDLGYLIDKRLDGRPRLWRFHLDRDDTPQVPELLGELPIPGAVTGADLADDARTLALVTPIGLHRLALPTPFPGGLADATRRSLGFLDLNCEAGAIVDDAIVTLSEGRTIRWFSPPRLGRPFAAAPILRLAPVEAAIDGDLGEWMAIAPATPSAAEAEVRIGWTAHGIALALRAPRGATAELRLGSAAAGRAPEYGPDDRRCRLSVVDGAASLDWAGAAPADARCAARAADDGWTAEVLLPAEAGPGLRLRIDAVITAADGRSLVTVAGAERAGGWSSPLAWADATLSEVP